MRPQEYIQLRSMDSSNTLADFEFIFFQHLSVFQSVIDKGKVRYFRS